MQKIWLDHYPAGVPETIDVAAYGSLVDLLQQAFERHAHKVAYRYMGRSISFAEVGRASAALAAYLQSLGLAPGDRVAVMLPNIPQNPIAMAAILRAGFVLVNVNPMYTARELKHQLQDSGARAIVLLENFAATLQEVLAEVPTMHVILTAPGDMLGWKGFVVNHVVRHVKKLVPPFSLPAAVRFKDALRHGAAAALAPATPQRDDLAVLQYTGGTTGVSKGAMLTHGNIVANVLQSEAWYQPALKQVRPDEQAVNVCALPIYHVFGFTACIMLGMHMGACNLLIADPRNIPALFRELRGLRFHSFPAVNTLFSAMARHPDVDTVDWRPLRLSVGGGAAIQSGTAALWLQKTGCPIVEGYGLSETSPTVACNPADSSAGSGTIGLPLPNTELRLIDEAGLPVAAGIAGEIAIKGPQVMDGYWRRPDETAKVMTADGYLRSGDIGVMDERGYFRIVDRKKDMILVSGFNVYPNEIEDVVSRNSGVLECAAVGVPDPKSGEAVKLVVVRKDPELSASDILSFCERELTGYKRPRTVEFRSELPKSAVGKILRSELRDAAGAL